MSDTDNHQNNHNTETIKVIDAILEWDLNFTLGNVVKCVARADKKDKDKYYEDLQKAAWYLNHEIRLTKLALGKG